MDVDEGDHGEIGLAAVVRLTMYLIPGNPSIGVTELQRQDVQGQWNVCELLKNLFATQDEEAIFEHYHTKKEGVNEFHRLLWPGFPIPFILKTKHEKKEEADEEQLVYLKKKTVHTSVAFAWVLWGMSYPRRDPSLRRKSWDFFVRLFEHAVAEAGRLSFRVKCVGLRGALDKMIAINIHQTTVQGRILWTAAVERLLSYQWNVCRLDENNFISSTLQRPNVLDVIYFGLNPANGNPGKLVQSLAHTLMAQFAAWVDEHLPVVALEAEGFQEARQKNRVAKQDALTHAMWKAINWYLHENDFWLF